MPDYNNQRSCFIENLIDAGCSEELIEKCTILKNQNKTNELMDILTEHKMQLLEIIHISTEKIDCLDYLLCKIKKEN